MVLHISIRSPLPLPLLSTSTRLPSSLGHPQLGRFWNQRVTKCQPTQNQCSYQRDLSYLPEHLILTSQINTAKNRKIGQYWLQRQKIWSILQRLEHTYEQFGAQILCSLSKRLCPSTSRSMYRPTYKYMLAKGTGTHRKALAGAEWLEHGLSISKTSKHTKIVWCAWKMRSKGIMLSYAICNTLMRKEIWNNKSSLPLIYI